MRSFLTALLLVFAIGVAALLGALAGGTAVYYAVQQRLDLLPQLAAVATRAAEATPTRDSHVARVNRFTRCTW